MPSQVWPFVSVHKILGVLHNRHTPTQYTPKSLKSYIILIHLVFLVARLLSLIIIHTENGVVKLLHNTSTISIVYKSFISIVMACVLTFDKMFNILRDLFHRLRNYIAISWNLKRLDLYIQHRMYDNQFILNFQFLHLLEPPNSATIIKICKAACA